MSGHVRLVAASAALLALLAWGCGRPRMEVPEGFAPLDGRGSSFRAVSPEGVRFQVRSAKNEPRQELAFWAEALRVQLAREGYRPSGEPQAFEAGGARRLEGRLYEWAMPYGTETWSYLTGILVAGRRILIIEAAGERSLYRRHRAAMLASLRTLTP